MNTLCRLIVCRSVSLAQLVNSLAAPTHVHSSVPEDGGSGSIPRADNLDSGSHPFVRRWLNKQPSVSSIGDRYRDGHSLEIFNSIQFLKT